MTSPSLLDWIMDLLRSEPARESFQANPQAAMASAGFSGTCADDVRDSKPFLLDHPHVKGAFKDDDDDHGHHGHHDDDDDAIEQIKFIVNNYNYSPHIENNYLDDDGGSSGSGDPDEDVDIEDSTVTDSLNDTDVSDDDGTVSSGGTVVDSEIMGDNEQDGNTVDRGGNLTNGDHSVDTDVEAGGDDSQAAGRDLDDSDVETDGPLSPAAGRDQDIDIVSGDQGDVDGGVAGLDDTVQTGDVTVLSDLINLDDGSDFIDDLPILSGNGTQSILDDLGPLL